MRIVDIGVASFLIALFLALVLSACGCACFRSTRVEARADYNVIAKDCSVSLVAVGYGGADQ